MWFRSGARLTNETQSFLILQNEESKRYCSIVWEICGVSRTIYESPYYINCEKRLNIIQDVLVGNDKLIDLRQESIDALENEYEPCPPGYVSEKIKEERAENEVKEKEDKAMDFLKENQGKFMTYEDYKNKDLPKVEKQIPIIATPKELADKLHEYRRANGWNMLQTAKAIGLEQSTVWGWFKAMNLPRNKKQRDILAKVLNVRFEKDM